MNPNPFKIHVRPSILVRISFRIDGGGGVGGGGGGDCGGDGGGDDFG